MLIYVAFAIRLHVILTLGKYIGCPIARGLTKPPPNEHKTALSKPGESHMFSHNAGVPYQRLDLNFHRFRRDMSWGEHMIKQGPHGHIQPPALTQSYRNRLM